LRRVLAKLFCPRRRSLACPLCLCLLQGLPIAKSTPKAKSLR
jgi:hypothetical protein